MDYPLLKNNLPQAIKNVWRKTSFLSFFIMLAIGIAAVVISKYFDVLDGVWLFILVIYHILTFVSFLISMLLVPFRYKFFRYEITDNDIIFQEGFIFRKITYVPLSRIQHIETEQGPFLRQDNLMELLIHTAATTHKIAGLSVEDTLNLRGQIIEKMEEANEDV